MSFKTHPLSPPQEEFIYKSLNLRNGLAIRFCMMEKMCISSQILGDIKPIFTRFLVQEKLYKESSSFFNDFSKMVEMGKTNFDDQPPSYSDVVDDHLR